MNSAKQIYHIVRRTVRPYHQAAAILKRAGLGLFLVLMTLTLFLYTRLGGNTRVYATASNQLNFQARLLTGAGAIVPDGNYSVQFNLYSVATAGTTQWTETQATVPVRAGYLSVYLGSVTAFPSTIDWSQQQWLTMNVNGDGEMTPRLKLTAVPNALHANEADGLRSGSNVLTADNFAQLTPATPQVINSALAALRLNQTGSGLLAQLQHNSVDVLSIANNGDVTSSGSATFTGGSLSLGAATQQGGLVLQDGAGKTGTLKTTTLSANRNYTLPDADGIVCLTTTCGGAANSFINGGNLFGAATSLGTNDNFALSFRTNNTNQLTLDTSGNLNFLNGGLQIGGTTVLTSGRVLQNVTTDTSILTSGTLGVGRGGTGLSSYTVGDLLYASGTTALSSLSDVSTGNVLLSGGVGAAPSWGKVTLGTHTTGSYVANIGTLTGLSATGNSGAGSTPTLSVLYGSVANTAVQGNTTLICPSGSGNLNGGGDTITLGSGGTCNALDTKAAVSFGTSVTTPVVTNAGGLTISTTGANDLTLTTGSGLLVLNASTIRRTAAGTTTFDLVDGSNTTLSFTNSGAGNLNLSADGTITAGSGLAVTSGGASITGNTSVASGTFTSSGGLISLNDGSNFGTKVNTGSSTGTITIGGGSAPLVIDSTAFDVSATGALSGITTITTSSTINSNNFTGTNLTFGGASGTISTTSNGNLTVGPNGSGVLALNTGSGGTLTTNANTIQRSGATGLTLDLANTSTTSLTVTNSDASNVANLSVEGGITAGTNSAFSVNTDGDITGAARQLDGSSTANGASAGGLGSSTSLTLVNAANFDIGNYVRVTSANCGGTGINPCFAKITAKSTNTLTITPALTWANGSAVVEFHFPEIGGVDTAQTLVNRYGRGYFISGVATGNGTTFYNEDSVTSSLANFDFLSGITGTLSLGVGANQITLGGSSTTTTFAGNVSFTGTVSGIGPNTGTSGYLQRNGTTISPATAGDSFTTSGNISSSGTGTITAAAGLTVQGGGASITGNSSVTGTLGVSNTLTVSAGGASVTGGLTLATGALNLTSGGITNAGSIVGIGANLTAAAALTISSGGSGDISLNSASNTVVLDSTETTLRRAAAGAYTVELNSASATSFVLNNTGAGAASLVLTDGDLSTGSTPTIRLTNAGALTNITGLTLISGGINVAGGGITNAGTISGLTGLTFNSGNLNLNSGGITNTGSVSGITGITFTSGSLNLASGGLTNGGAFSGITTLGLSGAIAGATSTNTINGLVINSGALSSITTISASGAITAATTTNTINGLIINSGAVSGATTINASGLITSVGLSAGTGLVQGTGGLTFTGSISLNNNASTNTTNIGTGTTSGQITIGGSSTPLVIDTTNFDFDSTNGLSIIGTAQISTRTYVPGTSGTTGQGYFIGSAGTPLSAFQGLDLGGNTYSFFGTNKNFNGTTWVDNGLGRVGSSFQIQNDAFTFYSFDTAANFTPRFTVASGGNVGIGLSGAPAGLLSVGGSTGNFQVSSTGAFTATSGLIQVTGTGAPLILNRTDGVIGSLKSGSAKVAFLFDNSGTFSIGTDTRANIAAGNTAGTDLLSIAANGNITVTAGLSGLTTLSLSGAITGATATNTINGLVINSGALSNITTINASGLATISGGATISGAAINLNASSNFVVNIGTGTSTGAVSIGGGSNTFALNSTALDISAAGVISGITGLTNANGNAGITVAACTAGQYIGNGVRLDDGTVTAGSCRNDATGLSDVRLKKDINTVGAVLDKLEGIRVVTFNFKVDELPELNLDHGLQYGVIAQELEQIFPELVQQRDDGYKEVNFKGLSFYTLKAVTELAAKVDAIGGGSGANEVMTDGVLRLSHDGVLQNITGFNIISGGATIAGGINNNGGGITNAGAVLGATTISGQGLVLNANNSDNLLTLSKDSKGVFTVFNNGALGLQTDAANAFSVKTAAGAGVFTIDTQNGKVQIGAGNTVKTVLFTLDSRSTVDDPAGTNGASYYNAASGRFRCYQDNRWQDCLPAGDLAYTIASDKVTLISPKATDQEFPGTPRAIANLSRAHEFRLSMRLTSAAATNTTCRLQYASSDSGPWSDLITGGAGDLAIDKMGTLKSEWVKIDENARTAKDTIIRVMCKGGDATSNATIYGISLQVR